MKKYILISVFLFLCFINQAQDNLDSLWNVWNNEYAIDSTRILALQKIISDNYLYSKPDSTLYFSKMMYDFSYDKGHEKGMANALNNQGVAYYFMNNYPKALDHYKRSLLIYERIEDKKSMANTLNKIGLIYMNQGVYHKALEYYQQSLIIKELISNKKGIAITLSNMGLVYKYQGIYPKAMEFYQRSLDIAEEISDKKGMARALNNLGIIYLDQNDYSNAMDYYLRSLKLKEEIFDKRGVANTLNNIGLIYMKQGDYFKALDYYQQSLKIKEQISDRKGIASTITNIGIVYMNQDEYTKALDFYKRSLNIYEEVSNNKGIAINSIYIGKTSIKQGDYTKAFFWCKKGLIKSEESNLLKRQKDACKCLYEAYKAVGNDAKALYYHERIIVLDDSLHGEETTKKLHQMEFARQMLADSLIQEEEKLRVQLVHESEIRNKNRTRDIFLFIAFLMLIAAVSIYRRVHFARIAKKAIEKEKDRSDKLLHNILPSEIAEELKLKGKAEAKNFDKVTILFSNFKGFTRISEKLSAEELVEEINSCFEPFDEICRKYGIEKIKTIGDAYMAAGGIPVPSDSAVKNTVLAGLEMMDCINRRKNEKKLDCQLCFEMRIGIHTGQAVAGIVGSSKFHYDIWGDSVNTASRIEDAGEVGKVNISQSTYELIKEDTTFKFEQRGKIMTKGKGEVEMWFVEKVG